VSGAISIWRIASQGPTWRANDLNGNGAARYPGRWNSLDRPIVYSYSSIALACLETVVHLAGDGPLPFPRQLVRITVPSEHWRQRRIFDNEEFSGWDSAPSPEHAEDWLAATRAQWRQVARVSWFVDQEFCRLLSKRMGKTHNLTSAADIAQP
jgi:RES domain-containing protein